ncbi:MAG TPA: sensor domain-containing diguanylate cyclase [Candidatus Acidoferrales bacterium]|nr:sensor domain-containing diguanylate cyclase [Candidatus Acidoferrales bacterium]
MNDYNLDESSVSPSEPPAQPLLSKGHGWDIVGICLCLVLAAASIFLLDTGPLVQWIVRYKESKLDEAVVAGIVFLVFLAAFSVGRYIGISRRFAHSEEPREASSSLDTAQLQKAQRRDLVWLLAAMATGFVFVFVFDAGWLADWIARHKDTKVDEAIVASAILLIGLSYFSIRRRLELSHQITRYEELHRKLVALNRETALLSEMSDLLQSCLSSEEAHKLMTDRARVLFPGTSGCVCIIANSRDTVEVVARWGEPVIVADSFAPQDCWALRRGRAHVLGQDPAVVSCAHLGDARPDEALCLPMMAQGETLGLLYLDTGNSHATNSTGTRTLSSESQQRLARLFAEQSALALANLNMREVLRFQSIRDPLTTLYNRRYMEESLDRELRRANRKKCSLGVMMLDIDHFKRFNDTYGHEAGDCVLRLLGNLLRSQFRAEDVVCRYGGEEFTVILPETSLAMTRERATRLCESAKELMIEFRGQRLEGVSISIGVSCYPENGTTGDSLLRAADSALYRAKAEGRDRAVVAHPQS